MNGARPYGSLMQAKDGKLYGVTYNGGSNSFGVIFSYDPSTSAYTNQKDLDHINGGRPYANLVQASDRKLYGMTSSGGPGLSGVIFSYDLSDSTYKKLKDFDNTISKNAPGRNPLAALYREPRESDTV